MEENKINATEKRRNVKKAAKIKEDTHKKFKTKTLSFNEYEHMVHLNMNYSESFLHLPTVATNEESKQNDSDKVMMFDIRKETNYLNNLLLQEKIKEEVFEDRHQRIETNLKNPELVHKVQDEEMIPYSRSKTMYVDLAKQIINRKKFGRLTAEQSNYLRILIRQPNISIEKISSMYLVSKSVLYSLKQGRKYSND